MPLCSSQHILSVFVTRYLLVEVINDMWLISDKVVQAVRRVGINEAVADPFGRLDPAQILAITICTVTKHIRLRDLSNKLKRFLNTFIPDILPSVDSRSIRLPIIPQDIERVLAGDSHHFARLRPRDTRSVDLDPSDHRSSLPIPEHDKPAAPCRKQCTTMDPLHRKAPGTFDESWSFLQVPVDFHLGFAFLHGVGVGVGSPSERGPAAECSVPPSQCGVNDIFAVSTDGDESAVR